MSGGYSADDLMHSRVMDAQGRKLGVITDLLIAPDDRVDQVIVETPIAPYESFAMDIERLKPEPAAGAEYSVDVTWDQIAKLPRYQRGPGTWTAPALRPQQ